MIPEFWDLHAGDSTRTDQEGRQFWVAAAKREGAGCLIVRADQDFTAFVELESAIREGTGIRNTS